MNLCNWWDNCVRPGAFERVDLGGTTFRVCAEHAALGTARGYWRSDRIEAEIEDTERKVKEQKIESVSMSDRFDALQWAGSRPGVLRLLLALKEANYDETGTEYLRRVAVRGG